MDGVGNHMDRQGHFEREDSGCEAAVVPATLVRGFCRLPVRNTVGVVPSEQVELSKRGCVQSRAREEPACRQRLIMPELICLLRPEAIPPTNTDVKL